MAKTSFRKYIVKLIKSDESDFRYYFFRSLIFDAQDQGTELFNEMTTNPLFRAKVVNTMCAKKLNQLSNIRFAYSDKITDTDAINYAFKLLDACKGKINRYIQLRREYERAYMQKEYAKALEYMELIESELGISLWSCGQKLMLKEQILGLEGNKNELTRMCNCINNGFIVLSILFFYSCMAERGLSYENYQTELMQCFGENKDTLVGRYLLGKLSFPHMIENKDISLMIQIDSQCSLIDLYNTVERYLPAVLHDCILEENMPNDLCIPKGIDANVFLNLQMLMGADTEKVSCHINTQSEIFSIIEEYTLGNYKTVVELATNYLKNNPSDLQIAILLCKSCICGEIAYPDGLEVQYVKAIYAIYSMSDEYREAIRDLKQVIKIHHGSILSQKVHALLMRKHLETGNEKAVFVSSFLDSVIHPNFLRYFEYTSPVSKLIAEKEAQYCPSAIALSQAIQSGDFEDKNLEMVAKEKRDYLLASQLCKQEDYDSALNLLAEIDDYHSKNFYLKERLERIRLAAYVGKKDYVRAVKTIVSIFFDNKYMYERLADNEYCSLPKRIKNKELNADIDYVIYRYITDSTDFHKQIAAYCNLLDYNNYSNILEFTAIITSDLDRATRFFFEKVCSVSLLRHDVTLHTLNISAESARLQILQKLSSVFPSKKYMAEIQNLLTSEAVKENLQAINKSKIYADTNKIFGIHKNAWEEVFAKYLTLRDADAYYIDIDMMSRSKDELDSLGIRFTTQQRVTQAAIVLKNIINQILEEILFSTQYGFETHLSSRIRHGYCKGQLTTFLDDYHLLSKRKSEDSDEYVISDYWKDRIVKLREAQDISAALSLFTGKIENKIAEILTTWLRIKYKEGSVGCFEYSTFTDFCLTFYYERSITNFTHFYNLIVDTFWAYMNKNLDRIRTRIGSELKEFYLVAIAELESDLRKIESSSDVIQEMLSNCNLAKAKVLPTMQQFSDAFTLNNSSYNDYSMDELVASCKRVVEKAHSNSEAVKWDIKADKMLRFSGKYFVSFVDILSILLNNAIEHSGFERYNDLTIKVSISEVEDRTMEEIAMIPGVMFCKKVFCLEVKNSLSNSIDTELLERNMKALFHSLTPNQIKTNKIQSEGGSGLYKLYNIAEYNVESGFTLICYVSDDDIAIRYNFIADALLAKEETDENTVD